MLGTYRLALALLVALSHIGVRLGGLNPGVMAVVGFYLVSGYVMTGLLRGNYARADRVGGFYLDRALRLFPHYLVVCVITFAWFAYSGVRTDFLKTDPSLFHVIANLTVVPLNYNMFNNAREFTLVPPAWSLGAEIQFYALFPLLLLRRLRPVAIMCSLVVYCFAALGVINTDWFGYRLLPGVLFMFLLGSLLFDLHAAAGRSAASRRGFPMTSAVIAASAIFAVLLEFLGRLELPYNAETLLGLTIGLAALNALGPRARHSLDEAMGNLSYGVFLNHFLIKWAWFDQGATELDDILAYLSLSILCSLALYYLVEAPLLRFRRKLRTRDAGWDGPSIAAGSGLMRSPRD